jgi:hypothetical protein
LNSEHFNCFTFILCSFGESCLLVSWCAGGRCDMTGNDEAGVGDLVQRTRDNRTGRVLGGQTIGRSDDTVSSLHHARGDEEHTLLG